MRHLCPAVDSLKLALGTNDCSGQKKGMLGILEGISPAAARPRLGTVSNSDQRPIFLLEIKEPDRKTGQRATDCLQTKGPARCDGPIYGKGATFYPYGLFTLKFIVEAIEAFIGLAHVHWLICRSFSVMALRYADHMLLINSSAKRAGEFKFGGVLIHIPHSPGRHSLHALPRLARFGFPAMATCQQLKRLNVSMLDLCMLK